MDKRKVPHPDTEALRSVLQSMERHEVKDLCQSAGLSLSTVTKFRSSLIVELSYAKAHALNTILGKRKPARRAARA